MTRVIAPRPRVASSLRILAALLPVLLVAPAGASPRPGSRAEQLLARPIAPVDGEKLQESEVLFTFERARAASESRLVLLPRAFDPTGWTAIPKLPDLVVHDAAKGVVTLAETGIALTGEARWWWSVASRDAATGAWRFTPVQSFTATPRFTNRVTPSPDLMRGVVGQMSPDEIRSQRTEALREMAPVSARQARATALTRALPADVPHIRLTAGYDFVPNGGSVPPVPAELSMSRVRAEPGALESYLVQFTDAPDAADFQRIAAAGGAVFAYIPDQAYLVRSSADARARITHQSRTAWVGDWEPAYKLSPRVDRAITTASRFEALLFPDADVDATKLALTAAGANVTLSSSNGVNKLVRFEARGDQIAAIAGLSGVAWIEPFELPVLNNDLAQWTVQTNVSGSRRIWDMGIKGENQVVMTSDSGINVLHDQFRDPAVSIPGYGDYPTHRKIIAYKPGSDDPNVAFGDESGAVFHGTHTACTIAGSDDPVAAAPYDGIAKNAKIYFMDIGGPSLGNSVSPFNDLNDLFLPPWQGNAGGAARISSNSWGSADAGAYTLNSLQVDQFMWAHPDFYIAFSNGNSGAFMTVGSPATAKDCAGMGGVLNGTSSNTLYSTTSRGPCADGRRKPTFAAPGNGQTGSIHPSGLYSADGATTSGYKQLQGTSMASPSGTGAVALIRQYLTEGWYPTGTKVPANGFSPSAALLKAMAINSADPITGSPIPDNNVGYGRINDDNVLYFAGDAKKLLLEDFTTGLSSGQFIQYQVNVVDSLVPLEVSLCWTDFPGSPAASVQLVNNLNLTVTKGANVWKGNNYSGTQSVTGGAYDALNVEEAVLLTTPTKGVYTVRIDAPTVPVGPQPFGLVITGGVGNGAGTLALDRAEYGSSSTVQLQIVDTNASGPLSVHLSSPTDPVGENATLTGSNGVFTGSLGLTPALTSTSDGLLSVSNGDVITATYSDASPVANLVATATVNFSSPVITNVRATSLGASGTLVTWTTDRNATSRVDYGTTGALELGSVYSTGYFTSHQVLIPNVTPGQTYEYDVESVSLSGSASRDDHGGAHYRFTGKPSGDIALLMSDPNFGRISTWTSALTDDNYDYDLITGTLSASPVVGDLNSGLRSYRAVVWQCGPDDYPPVTDAQRPAIDSYMAGGGRLWILGHDLGWGLASTSSPGYNPTRAAWLSSALHANFLADPATWSIENGYAGDPISGGFVSPNGMPYSPFGSGQSGDEISINAGSGTGSYVWIDNNSPAGNNVFRWTDGVSDGSPSTAVWGGQPSRLVSQFLEFTAIDPPYTSASAIRDTVLNRTLLWLFGRSRPTVALITPNGGETITSSPANISWTETVGPGANLGSRRIEYSTDGGDSWTTLTTNAGASPYSWNLAGVPNTTHARIRIKLTDDGAPTLSMTDASLADFTINISGNDVTGPVVVPGSIASNPNPIVRGNGITLTATVSDASTGGAAVDQAEWSFGPNPAPAGSGTAMTGSFGTSTVNVSLSIATGGFTLGNQKLWVRGHDAAGNWGPASALSLLVNGTGNTGVDGGIPAVAFLGQSAPNPAVGATTIQFGLARGGDVALDVFDAEGRLVKQLARGAFAPGYHVARWDGRDASGARVGAGVYFYRLVSPEGRFEKRMAMLQ